MIKSGTKRGAKAFTHLVHSYSPFSMALSQFCSFFCESVFFISRRAVLGFKNAQKILTDTLKNFLTNGKGFGISKQFTEFRY